MDKEELKILLKKVFDNTGVYFKDVERLTDKSFTIVFGNDVEFKTMLIISELFDTKNINFGSETRRFGYCDTCAYTYTVKTLTVSDYSLNSSILNEIRINNLINKVKELVADYDLDPVKIAKDALYTLDKVRALFPDYEVTENNNEIIISWKKWEEARREKEEEEYNAYWSSFKDSEKSKKLAQSIAALGRLG